MSCIQQNTDKIVGNWEIVDGVKVKDQNWQLIENYISNEAQMWAQSYSGYLYVEVSEERAWHLSYRDSNAERKGPPTLQRMIEAYELAAKRAVYFSDLLSHWQSEYSAYTSQGSGKSKWPKLDGKLLRTIVPSEDFRRFWKENKRSYAEDFAKLMDQVIEEYGG